MPSQVGYTQFTGLLRGSSIAAGVGVVPVQPAWPHSFGLAVCDCNNLQIGLGYNEAGTLKSGLYARMPVAEGASLLDIAFVDLNGNEIGLAKVEYVDGEVVYPWTVSSIDFTNLQNDVDSLHSDVLALDALVDATNIDVQNNSTNISSLNDAINNLSSTCDGLDIRLNAIEAQLPASFNELYRGTPNLTVFNSFLTGTVGTPVAGAVFTRRATTSALGVPIGTTYQEGFSFIKTQAYQGTLVSFKDYNQDSYVGIGFNYNPSISGVYSRTKNQRYASGIYSCLGSVTAEVAGTQAFLSYRDNADKIWAGYFGGNIMVGGDAYMTGTAFGDWADFALTDNLMPLQEVESFIAEEGRLPWLSRIEERVSIAAKLTQLAECVERLTRYVIQLNKERK